MATPSQPTLYERLGGVYSIATVLDDPCLNANPRVDEAHHRVSRAGFILHWCKECLDSVG
jgi:hemoglobin